MVKHQTATAWTVHHHITVNIVVYEATRPIVWLYVSHKIKHVFTRFMLGKLIMVCGLMTSCVIYKFKEGVRTCEPSRHKHYQDTYSIFLVWRNWKMHQSNVN